MSTTDPHGRNKRRRARAEAHNFAVRRMPGDKPPHPNSKRTRFGTFVNNSEETELRKALRVDGMAKRRHTPSMPKLPWEDTTT